MRPRRAAPAGLIAADGEAALVRRIGRGDEAAFEALFDRYRDPIHRYCRAVLRHEQDAEDAFQATMIRAYRALRRGAEALAVRPWLFRIAHNECMRLAGARRDHAGLSGEERAPGSPAELAETREELAQLRRDLLALPDQQRAALVLREMSGLSHAQIGQALGTTSDAAKHLIHEGRTSLGEFAAGRSLACGDVRRRISDGDGRVLRARSVRSHLRGCDACREFREAIGRRPRQLAALFPALPAVAAQRTLAEVLAAFGGGGPGALAAGSGAGLGAKAMVAWVAAGALVVSGGALLPTLPAGGGPDAADAAPSQGAGGASTTSMAGAAASAAAPAAGPAGARGTAPARAGSVEPSAAGGPEPAPAPVGDPEPGDASGPPADPPAPAPSGGGDAAPDGGPAVRAAEATRDTAAAPPPVSVTVGSPPGGGAEVGASLSVPLPVAPVTADAQVSVTPDSGVAVGAEATVATPVAPVEVRAGVTVGGGSTASVRLEAAPALGLPPVEVTVPRLLGR
ncbi:sigma-70 family RNA polymerase sigma factor [Miltoncostaea marina]|uniref:sigma-70 family RNA polymerase sigma factor n=1 Tax=Miltoncostaea marina TaxID=2843215 RepID=UPI001C3D4E67|nr:sigma-70 family RNA polymerase sigma factor [Miltoncostaea marina]